MGRVEIVVRPQIDAAADDHLCELQSGDHHGDETRWVVAHGAQRVVRIHHRVHAVVHNNEPSGRRRVFGVGEPGVDQHRDVMIPVEEDQRLLAQHYEDRVAKFRQFRQHEQPCPEAGYAILLDVAVDFDMRKC